MFNIWEMLQLWDILILRGTDYYERNKQSKILRDYTFSFVSTTMAI